jgi:hypothetical protein
MTLKNNLLAAFCTLSLVGVGCYDVQYTNPPGAPDPDAPIDPTQVVPEDPVDPNDPTDPNNPDPNNPDPNNPDPNNTDRAVIETFSASPTEVEAGGASTLSWTMLNATEGEIREGLNVIYQIPAEMLQTGTYEIANITEAKEITISIKGVDAQAVTNRVTIDLAADPMNPDPDPNPNPNPTTDPAAEAARMLFDTTVAPIIMAKCSNGACHGAPGQDPLRFVPAGPITAYYDTVTSYTQVVADFQKSQAPLLNRLVPTPHFGLTYDAAETMAIEVWLDAEYAWRSTTTNPIPMPTGPGAIEEQLIQEWSGCMDLATFTTENVAEEWAYLDSGEGYCLRCHFNGYEGFIASDETTRVFNILTTDRTQMRGYFAPDLTDMANPKMVINTQVITRVANGLPPNIEHPRFDEVSTAMDALNRFYTATMARKAAGTCDPPRMPPP